MEVHTFRQLSQILVAILGIYFYFNHKTKFSKLLLFLLVSIVITESIGFILNIRGVPSFFVYTFYTFFEFFIISIMYYNLIKYKYKKSIFYSLSLVFFIFWIIVFFDKTLFPYLIILDSLTVSLYIFLYLKELLLSDEIMNYKQLLPFWVSVGFLIFYLSSIPFFTFFNYMKNRGLFPVLDVLIILMNITIVYGLLCSKKEVKY